MPRGLYDLVASDSKGQNWRTEEVSFNLVLSCKCQMQIDFSECYRVFYFILPCLSCQDYQEVSCFCTMYYTVLHRSHITTECLV